MCAGGCASKECAQMCTHTYIGMYVQYVLTRSVYQPDVCTNQECVPTKNVYQP